MERLLPRQMQQLLLDPQTPRRMRRLRPRQMQRFLLDAETQTFLLDHPTAAAHPTTFALASNLALSAVWPKSGRRTLGAIRRRIDPVLMSIADRAKRSMIRVAVTAIV